jgi:hypothetical protein
MVLPLLLLLLYGLNPTAAREAAVAAADGLDSISSCWLSAANMAPSSAFTASSAAA